MKISSIRRADKESVRKIETAALAIALSRTHARAALVDERGRILVQRRADIVDPAARAVSSLVASLAVDIASSSDAQSQSITSLGVSVPGVVDRRDQRVTVARRPMDAKSAISWNRVNLKDAIDGALSSTRVTKGAARIPKSAELVSRAGAAVLAETLVGAAKDAQDAVYLYLDEQFEAGLLTGGQLVRGATGRAGGVGWLALSEGFRQEFSEAGCLVVEAGARSLVRRTIESWTGKGSSTVGLLSVTDPSALTPDVVARAARAHDQLAQTVVADVCGWLGRAMAVLISTLNPEAIILGGDFGRALRPFYGDLRKEARRWAEPNAGRSCRIVGASLGDDAMLIGAARASRGTGNTTG